MYREQDRIELWTSLISESALRSPAVANMLHRIEPSNNLAEHVNKVPKNKRWFSTIYLVNKSLYTQCLTIATTSDVDRITSLSLLKLLKKLRAPGSMKLEFLLLIFITATLSSLFAYLKTNYLGGSQTISFDPVYFLMVLFFDLLFILLFLRIIIQQLAYSQVLQIKRFTLFYRFFGQSHIFWPTLHALSFMVGKTFRRIVHDIIVARDRGLY